MLTKSSGRLFDKRGALYSSRPENYVGGKLICPNEIHILLAQYGPRWRTLRKSVQGLLNVSAVDALHPIQTAEATQTMCQLLDDPAGYYDHIRRYSTAVILASVFGQRGESFQSPKVQALYHAQDRFTAILEPGATPPVDAFPFLKAIPEFLSPWRKEAKEIRQEQSSLYFKLLDETRDRIRKGHSTSCFMEKIMDDQEKIGFSDEQVAYLGGILVNPLLMPYHFRESIRLTFFLDGGWVRYHIIDFAYVRARHVAVPGSSEKGT